MQGREIEIIKEWLREGEDTNTMAMRACLLDYIVGLEQTCKNTPDCYKSPKLTRHERYQSIAIRGIIENPTGDVLLHELDGMLQSNGWSFRGSMSTTIGGKRNG